jgi:hypothetical protein
MKNIYYILVFIIASHKIYSQTPTYSWTKVNHGEWEDFATGVATDLNHNVIEVGHFQSANFNVQGQILTQSPDTNGITNDYADSYIVKYDSSGAVLWRLKTVGLFAERALSVTTDNQANIFVAGYYNGDFTKFGSVQVTNTGDYFRKAFLMKLSPTGTVLWTKTEVATIGTVLPSTLIGRGVIYTSVKTDANGNAFVMGKLLASSITIGTSLLNNTPDLNTASGNVIFAKYDSLGNVVWAKTNKGGGFEESNRLDIDAVGNVYAIGSSTSDTLTINSTAVAHPGYVIMPSPFVLKMDNSGNTIWLKRFAGYDFSDYGSDISVDVSGNVYICGQFLSSQINFAGTTLLNNLNNLITQRNPDLYIAKYNANGVEQWIKGAVVLITPSTNLNSKETATAIKVDNNGCIYLSGTFSFPISLGGFNLSNSNPPTSLPTDDGFIAKYNDAGSVVWLKTYGGPGNDLGYSITLDQSNNVLIAGYFGATAAGITFDNTAFIGHTGTNAFRFDAFLTKLNASASNCAVASSIQTEKNNSLSLFPNPNNGLFTIKSATPISEIKIMDVFNRIIFSNKNKMGYETAFDLSQQANGIYIIEVGLGDNKKEMIKLIKQ